MTRDDFEAWKAHPITDALFYSIKLEIQDLERQLGISAGIDPLADRYKTGQIMAYKELLNVNPEEVLDNVSDS